MATLPTLKPYIDLGMTAELLQYDLALERKIDEATIFVYKLPTTEDKQGFSGFYYIRRFEKSDQQMRCCYVGNWNAVRSLIGEELLSQKTWKLDPARKWQPGILSEMKPL
jgi:hypothetical protein